MTDIEKYRRRRIQRLRRRGIRMDDGDDEVINQPQKPKKSGGGGHGNTRLPYGLAIGEGIDTKGMTPKEVWAALAGEGYSPAVAYKGLKEGKKGKDLKTSKPKEIKKVEIGSMPSAFSEKTARKLTQGYIDELNNICHDSDVMELIGSPVDSDTFSLFKVKKTDTDSASFSYYPHRPAEIKVPKFDAKDSDDIKRSKLATFLHEYTHMLNHYSREDGDWNECFTNSMESLISAIKEESDNDVSETAAKEFKEYSDWYNKSVKEFKDKIKTEEREFWKKLYPDGKPEWINESGGIDYWKYNSRIKDEVNAYNRKKKAYLVDMEREFSKQRRAYMSGNVNLQGLYDSISGGKRRSEGTVKYGHSLSYFSRDKGNSANELLSDYVALAATNPEKLKIFEDNYPKTAKELRKAMKLITEKARTFA